MRKIAIVRRNGFGDLLCTIPLIRYLQNTYPQDEITLFVDERNAPLLPYIPYVPKFIVFPSRGNKYLNLFFTAIRQRSKKFDISISAKTSPMKLMNFFLYFLGARERIAYVNAAWHSRMINRPLILAENCPRHQALKNLQSIAPHFKEVPKELYPIIKVPETSEKKESIEAQPPYLFISASINREESRLSEEKYAKIVNRLGERYRFTTLLVSQEKDRQRAKAIAVLLKRKPIVHFPRNFDQFMVLLNQCHLYFVGDGGIGHLGAGLGKKGIVLFGVTCPIEWAPLSDEVIYLSHRVHVNCIAEDEIVMSLEKKILELLNG
jgi:ADP-heptose:LPS heptosyltransferase